MSQQIIKQPDGLYCVWSIVVDNFVQVDATLDEIIAKRVAKETVAIRKNVNEIVAELDAGGKPYAQFTMTYEEAVGWIKELREIAERHEVVG